MEEEIEQFAARIKNRYPEYNDVDDIDLVEKFVTKHPVYASRVKLPANYRLLKATSGHPKIDDLYEQIGREEGVDPNLLLEQGRTETDFDIDVWYGRKKSSAGATGAGQFMAGTAGRYGLTVNANQDDRTDPIKSLRAQAKYMRKLLDQFDNDESLALAGYNAGEARPDTLGKGVIPNIPETQKYVQKTLGNLKNIRSQPSTLRSLLGNQSQQQNPIISPTYDDQGNITAEIDGKVQKLQQINPQINDDNRTEKDIRRFMDENGLKGRTFGKAINKGSLHPFGLAADISIKGKTQAELEGIIQNALENGFRVVDERKPIDGIKQSAPHIHLEINPRKASTFQSDDFYSPNFANNLRALDGARFGQAQKNPTVANNSPVQQPSQQGQLPPVNPQNAMSPKVNIPLDQTKTGYQYTGEYDLDNEYGFNKANQAIRDHSEVGKKFQAFLTRKGLTESNDSIKEFNDEQKELAKRPVVPKLTKKRIQRQNVPVGALEKTGKFKIGDVELTEVSSFDLTGNQSRVKDADGETYIIDKDKKEIQDESLKETAEQVTVRLTPYNERATTPPEMALRLEAEEIANALSPKYKIARQDVVAFVLDKGIIDQDKNSPTYGQKLPEDRLYTNPANGLKSSANRITSLEDTDVYSLSRRGLQELIIYSKDSHGKREQIVLDMIASGKTPSAELLKQLEVNLDNLKSNKYDDYQMSLVKGKVAADQFEIFKKQYTEQGLNEYKATVKADARMGRLTPLEEKKEIEAYDKLEAEENRINQMRTSGTTSDPLYGGSLTSKEELSQLAQKQTDDYMRRMQSKYGTFANVFKKREEEAQAEAERKKRIAKLGYGEWIDESVKTTVRGFGQSVVTNLISNSLRGGALYTKPVADYLSNLFGVEGTTKLEVKDHLAYKAADYLDQDMRERFSVNQDLEQSFVQGTLPKALGSSLAFVFPSLSKYPRAAIALYSTLGMGGASYDEARKSGASEVDAQKFALLNSGLFGWTEIIGISKALIRLNSGAGGTIWRKLLRDVLKEGSKEIPEEVVLNELPQTLGENILAQQIYDPDRPADKGLAEGLIAAGLSAGLVSTAVTTINTLKNSRAIKKQLQIDQENGGAEVRNFGDNGFYVYGKEIQITDDLKPLVEKNETIKKDIADAFKTLDDVKKKAATAPKSEQKKYGRIIADISSELSKSLIEQENNSQRIIEKSGIDKPIHEDAQITPDNFAENQQIVNQSIDQSAEVLATTPKQDITPVSPIIRREQVNRLSALGYTNEQIDAINPSEANILVQNAVTPAEHAELFARVEQQQQQDQAQQTFDTSQTDAQSDLSIQETDAEPIFKGPLPENARMIDAPQPEREVTLNAQQKAMLDRKNNAAIGVLFTDGERVPDPKHTFIKEISTPHGVMHVSMPKLKQWWLKNNPGQEYNHEAVIADIESGTINTNDLIGGKVVDFGTETVGGTAVVTVDAQGNELNATKISDNSPENLTPDEAQLIEKQEKLDKKRFGNKAAKTGVTLGEEVVNSRRENRPITLQEKEARIKTLDPQGIQITPKTLEVKGDESQLNEKTETKVQPQPAPVGAKPLVENQDTQGKVASVRTIKPTETAPVKENLTTEKPKVESKTQAKPQETIDTKKEVESIPVSEDVAEKTTTEKPKVSMNDIFQKSFDKKFGRTEQQKKQDDVINELNDLFDLGIKKEPEPDTLKSAIGGEEEFDEEKYQRVKPVFERALEAFATSDDPQETMDNLLTALIDKGAVREKILEMQPYIVRYMEERFNAAETEEKPDREIPQVAKFTDSLNIPRAEMPQIRREDFPEFKEFAASKGVAIKEETVDIADLKPTQSEYSPAQTAQLPESALEKPLMVSSDNRVLDGHNTLKKHQESDNQKITIRRIELPALEALALMKEFPKTTFKNVTDIGRTDTYFRGGGKVNILEELKQRGGKESTKRTGFLVYLADNEKSAKQWASKRNNKTIDKVELKINKLFDATSKEFVLSDMNSYFKGIVSSERMESFWDDEEDANFKHTVVELYARHFPAEFRQWLDEKGYDAMLNGGNIAIWNDKPIRGTSFSTIEPKKKTTVESEKQPDVALAQTINDVRSFSLKESVWTYFDKEKYEAAGEAAKLVYSGNVISYKDESNDPKFKAGGLHPVVRAYNNLAKREAGDSNTATRAPITVSDNGNGTYTVIDGNATTQAAHRIGWRTLPVIIQPPVARTQTAEEKRISALSQSVRSFAETVKDSYFADVQDVAAEISGNTPNEYYDFLVKSESSLGKKLKIKAEHVPTDLLRTSIIIPDGSVEQTTNLAYTVVDLMAQRGYKIVANADGSPDFTNRFEDDAPGYKDINIKFIKGENDPVVRELILIQPAMAEAKVPGHLLYDQVKDLSDRIKNSVVTDKQKDQLLAQMGLLNDEMATLYSGAVDLDLLSPSINAPNPTIAASNSGLLNVGLAVKNWSKSSASELLTANISASRLSSTERAAKFLSVSVISNDSVSQNLKNNQKESKTEVEATDGQQTELLRSGQQNASANQGVGKQTPSDAGNGPANQDLGSGQSETAQKSGTNQSTDAVTGKSDTATGLGDGNQDTATQSTSGGLRDTGNGGTTVAPVANNFAITDELDFNSFSPKTRYRKNVEAIRLINQLQEEDRSATPEEQSILAQYVGWGGLKSVFDESSNQWSKEYTELKELLSDEEFAKARASTLNAHFTSKTVVSGIWNAAQHLGFTKGGVLEPSMGTGNFFGLMPSSLRPNSQLTGVELEPFTSAIAKHLYPNAQIWGEKGLQEVFIAPNTVDLAIGNPPFGDETIFDKNSKELSKLKIHAYFFARSIDAVRPGGVLAMVVSKGFLDARDQQAAKARQYVAEKAKLIGAIRLPNTAFEANANTAVTTDIVFLQKLDPENGIESNSDEWLTTDTLTDEATGGDIHINKYFKANPEMMLGKMTLAGKMYAGGAQPTLEPHESQDLELDIAKAVKNLPENIIPDWTAQVTERLEEGKQKHISEYKNLRPYNFGINSKGVIFQTEADPNGFVREIPQNLTGVPLERVKGMIGIREIARELLAKESDIKITDEDLKPLREKLNKLYDAFYRKYGYISQDGNKQVFRNDADFPLLLALEKDFDKGVSRAIAIKEGVEERKQSAKKADIFTKRTVQPFHEVTSATSAKDAMINSLNERGLLDFGYMSQLYGKDQAAIIAELGDLVYHDPTIGAWVTSDEYLSGDVKTKLAKAEEAALANPELARNVAALEKVIPKDLNPSKIFLKLGSNWIPSEVYQQFVADTLQGQFSGTYNAVLGKFTGLSIGRTNPTLDNDRWGTPRMAAGKIIEGLLSNKFPTVTDKVWDADTQSYKDVANEQETAAAQGKAEEILEEFQDWIWRESARRQAVATLYNERFNRRNRRTYDGTHLTLPGLAQDMSLRRHIKNGVFRALQTGKVMFDHVVGAGKTPLTIAVTMEMRRLGQAKKPMVVVPNHLVEQWAKEYKQFYPGANVLAATKKDFEKGKRRELFAKIATGDWDAVVVAHSSFEFIPVPEDVERDFIHEQANEVVEAIRQMKADNGDKRTIRQLEKLRDKLNTKMQTLANIQRDDLLNFAEMGVDALFVDEAHEFKNLFFNTQKQGVGSLGNPKGSQKAFDMFMKTQMIQRRNNGRNVFFMTGTPVSNSLSEIFHMQRFLQLDKLKEAEIHTFDAWANTFGQDTKDWELNAAGQFKEKTRFIKFANLPELKQLWHEVTDSITNADIQRAAEEAGEKFPIPKVDRIKVIADRSPQQAAYIGVPQPVYDKEGNPVFDHETGAQIEEYAPGTIINRLENWKNLEYTDKNTGERKPENVLRITTHARQVGLDARMIMENAPDFAGGKVNRAVEEIYKVYKENDYRKGTQLVFLDLSTPKKERIAPAPKAAASTPQAVDRKPQYFLNTGDGIKHIPNAKPITLSVAPDVEFFSYKAGNSYVVSEKLSGQRIGDGAKTLTAAVANAERRISSFGLEKLRRLLTEKTIPQADIDAYLADYADLKDMRDAATEAGDNIDADIAAAVYEGDESTDVDIDEALAPTSNYSAYIDIRNKLLASGIPAEHIAFIHDYNTDLQKADLFAKVNRGDIRIVLGSTKKMGAGTNVQKKLVALHNLDVPWKPSDLEQRVGRIVRQGNEFWDENFTVKVFDYATEKTYDARMWEVNEQKGTAIDRFRTGGADLREIEDISPESANAAEMKASASGDPRILQSIQLNSEIKKLTAQEKTFKSSKFDLQDKIQKFDEGDTFEQRRVEVFEEANTIAENNPKNDDTTVTIGTNTWKLADIGKDTKEDVLNAIVSRFQRGSYSNTAIPFGTYRGFDVMISKGFISSMYLTLRRPGKEASISETQFKDFSIITDFGKELSVFGVLTRLENMVAAVPELLENNRNKVSKLAKSSEDARVQLTKEFPKAKELADIKQRHKDLLLELRSRGRDAVKPQPHLALIKQIEKEIAKQNVEKAKSAMAAAIQNNINIAPRVTKPMAEPHGLFKKLDGFTGDDLMTYEQMLDLPFVEFDELLQTAKAEMVGNNIKANAASHEIFRRAFEEIRMREKTSAKDAEDLFGGVFLKPETITKLKKILTAKRAEAEKAGYSADELVVFDDHINVLAEAAKTNKTAVVYIFDKNLPHELFHQADYLGAIEKSLLSRHTPEGIKTLNAHPLTTLMREKYFSKFKEYKRHGEEMTLAQIRSEMLPTLLEMSDDEIAALGVSQDMIDDYQLQWFTDYAAKNGIDALDNFEKDELNVQETINKIKESYSVEDGAAGQADEVNNSKQQNASGETGGSAATSAKPSGRLSAGSTSAGVETPEPSADTSEAFGTQKQASLPETMRLAGIDADDLMYEVFGDRAATASAQKMLADLGIDGAIAHLRNTKDSDVDHAILSFMLIRGFLNKAAEIEKTDPKRAAELRADAQTLAKEHTLRSVAAGRFTRAASVIGQTVESVIVAANAIVQERFGQDAGLSPAEQQRLEDAAAQAEAALQKVTELSKDKNNLNRKIKRLQDELDGKTKKKKKSKKGLTLRVALVNEVKEKQQSAVDSIRTRLLAKFKAEPDTQKSVLSEPDTLKAALSADTLTMDDINDFAEIGAMFLTEGLATEFDYLPDHFKADMTAEFGDIFHDAFETIYLKSWQQRTNWLNEIRKERKMDAVRNKEGADLTDEEVEEILGDRKERAMRRRAIENIHRLTAGAKRTRNNDELNSIIMDMADSDASAQAAVLINEKLTDQQIYTRLDSAGITDQSERQDALRAGNILLGKAKAELKIQRDAVADGMLAAQAEVKTIDALRFKARLASMQAQQHLANELRRLKQGTLSYRGGQVWDATNAFRTMMASFDLSAGLRQGGFFAFAAPEEMGKAFGTMFTSFSEKGYGENIQTIEDHARFMLAQQMGIDFAMAGKTDNSSGEELYRGDEFIEKLEKFISRDHGTVLTKFIVKPSERTYTAFLDMQRMVMFDVFAQELIDSGYDPRRDAHEFKKIAEFVNIATGRGTVSSGKVATIIRNLPFFAPRYTLSRLQLINMTLNPVAYYNMPAGARKIVAKKAARFYGTTLGTLGLVGLLGAVTGLASVNWDDDDDDFLKIKIGNAKYDMFAGTLQPAKMLIKLMHSAIRTKGGFDNRMPGEIGIDTAYTVGRFLRGKLSPIASLIADFGLDEDYNHMEFSWGKAIYSRMIPLTISDAINAYKLDGTVGVAKTIPAIFGLGVNTYKERPERAETEAEKLASKMGIFISKPQTEESKKERDLISDLTARARKGEDVSGEVRAAFKAGAIDEKQKKNILAAKTESFLEQKAGKLSVDQLKVVMKIATDAEKAELQPMIDEKEGNKLKRETPKSVAEKLKRSDTDKAVELYLDTAPDMDGIQKMEFKRQLREKTWNAARRGTLTPEELENVKKVIPEIVIPAMRPKRETRPERPKRGANDSLESLY